MKFFRLTLLTLALLLVQNASAQKPLDLKEAEGLYKLGEKAYEHQDYIPCYQYMLNAANAGYAPAYFRMAVLCDNGLGTEKNMDEAAKWYLKSAESGNAEAQLIMAKAYSNGTVVNRDEQQALVWLTKAADQKNAEAEFYMGMAYFNGFLVEKSLDKALQWIKLSAEKNYNEAQHNLGVLYYEGVYTERDMKQAIKWFTLAAENNYALSQYVLGVIYYEGIYTDQDYALALKWWLKAAEQGNADAQYNSGLVYYMGYGITRDNDKAMYWMEKAAAQQYKKASEFLASVESDRTKALDTAVYRGLKHPLTKTDLEHIRQKATDCFYIEGNLSLSINVQDLIPVSQRVKDTPSDKKSVDDMKKRLDREPNNYNLRISLGDAYTNQNKSTEAAKMFDEAERILKSQQLVNSSDTLIDFWLGMVAYKRNRYPDAVAYLNSYMQKHPKDNSANYFMIMALMQNGDRDKLVEFNRTLISKYPYSADGYIMQGMVTMASRFSNAEEAAQAAKTKSLDEVMDLGLLAKAIQQYPDSFKLQFTYNAFRQMGFLMKAGDSLMLDHVPHYKEQDQEDFNKMESFYLKALERKDLISKYVIYKFMASLYVLGHQFDKSLEYARKAIDIKKNEPFSSFSSPSETYDLMAAIYCLKKDTLAAEKITEEKIQTMEAAGSGNYKDYIMLAEYQLMHDAKAAEKSLKKAGELNPTNKRLWLGYACYYIVTGNTAKASEALKKASSPCEEDEEEICYSTQGIIDMLNGKYESAFKNFKQAQVVEKDYDLPGKLLKNYFK